MSRNLCTSSCESCGYTVRLSDLRDKPIEFRKYGPYAPQIGCKFICECGEVYFAIWRHKDGFWDSESLKDGSWKTDVRDAGKFATEYTNHKGEVVVEQTGCFVIDLSYYATYNDEKHCDSEAEKLINNGTDEPWHLCEDNAEEVQWIWYSI